MNKKTGRQMMLELNLPQLQNLIKRDKESYRDEFLTQLRHFQSCLDILLLNPSQLVKDFNEIVLFLAHVSHCYQKDLLDFGDTILSTLRQSYALLHPDTRKTMIQALMLLRSKKQIDQAKVLSLFFFLFRCRDKNLRSQLYLHIVSDVKAANSKGKNHKLNKSLQQYMYSLIVPDDTPTNVINATESSGDATDICAKYSLDVCIELYRRNVWNDSKTVNIIAEACLSPYPKVLVAALKFFLGTDRSNEESDEEQDEDVPSLAQIHIRANVTKNSKGQQNKFERAMRAIKKKEKRAAHRKGESTNQFSALHLLNDPQGLCEKLFTRIAKSQTKNNGDSANIVVSRNELKFELRLMIMNFISRLIGIHKLTLLNFYPYLIRYLKPHQQDVTTILAICAQASHDMVPPEAIEEIVRAIIDNFATDAFSPEVISAGLNSIREICCRAPLAIDETLLAYLLTFKSHRDKGVMMAARSLITLYRDVNPEMLPKRDRGRTATMELAATDKPSLLFGSKETVSRVPGAEFLNHAENLDENESWNMESESEENEDDEGWIKVSDDENPKSFDDSNEPRGRKPKRVLALGVNLTNIPNNDDEEDISNNEESELEIDSEEIDNSIDLESVTDTDHETENELESDTIVKTPVEMQRFLTPADFALMKQSQENRQAELLVNGPDKNKKSKRRERSISPSTLHNVISTSVIEGTANKRRKQTKEERIATMNEGKKGREKFGSKKGKLDRGSTTNREKSKKKNFMMIVHKRSVVAKGKASLRDKQKTLRKHIEKQKKQGH